jgi:hypothetical protein
MRAVSDREPQIARGEARMFAHHSLGPCALAVLDGVDHDAMMILPEQQDLMRFRQRRLRHHERAWRSERQRGDAIDFADQRRA